MINLHRQNGMMLFIVMLILPLLLTLGTLLMGNSFLGLRIVDSRVMQVESAMLLNGAAHAILNDQNSPQLFAEALDSGKLDSEALKSDAFSDVTTTVELNGELTCKRTMRASGTNNGFKCKYLQVNLNHSYGRETSEGAKWAVNSMGLGVEQPIIAD